MPSDTVLMLVNVRKKLNNTDNQKAFKTGKYWLKYGDHYSNTVQVLRNIFILTLYYFHFAHVLSMSYDLLGHTYKMILKWLCEQFPLMQFSFHKLLHGYFFSHVSMSCLSLTTVGSNQRYLDSNYHTECLSFYSYTCLCLRST